MSQPEAPKIEFPCDDYMIKVVGDAEVALRDFVHQVLVRYDASLTPDSFTSKPSRNGRFESLTVFMRVEQEGHLSELFDILKADDRVKMVI
ncbi:hypothetical protein BGP77_09305 [Saccharospirillum sp. MSK14-1]|uniref:HP0495 family protein n=1 Tax=Saccharospirillum sp. MSK14-1 TaxID=1897632 RepID=UPI000D4C2AD1|nr:DUF493 domain-containing protein [Saccharospirillum sp. MSK14-1]PTY38943.1 hypothetical protein BGP77_09305 [Saccharospirillum sp. MSK14-1]